MSAVVWVPEDDWSTAKIGDLVKLERGDEVLIFRVSGVNSVTHWISGAGGWSLFVQSPPAVVLPTERGAYHTSTGSLFVLNAKGDWLDFSLGGGGVNNRAANNPAYHPFTRLEPVPVTAKKVLDRIVAESRSTVTPMRHELSIGISAVNMIAREHGVTW